MTFSLTRCLPEAAADSRLRDLQLGDEEENHYRHSVVRDDQDHRGEVEDGVATHQAGLRGQGRGHQRVREPEVPEPSGPDPASAATDADAASAATETAAHAPAPTAASGHSRTTLSRYLFKTKPFLLFWKVVYERKDLLASTLRKKALGPIV